jgi:hypothetical protein
MLKNIFSLLLILRHLICNFSKFLTLIVRFSIKSLVIVSYKNILRYHFRRTINFMSIYIYFGNKSKYTIYP